jgi:predicted transcriptional regulator
MKEEKFLMVSLEEGKAKKLALAISSDTARKLLDRLTNGPATETGLAEELDIPISTVHYNLRNLIDSGLIKADEFHYSDKGKEVNHYSLANKFIIIAPRMVQGMSLRLKKAIPVLLIGLIGSGLLYFINRPVFSPAPQMMLKADAMNALAEGASAAPRSLALANTPFSLLSHSAYLWFFIGIIIAVLANLLIDWLKER